MRTLNFSIIAFMLVAIAGFLGCATTHASQAAGDDRAKAAAYAKPGFHTEMEDGRLWVFRENSEALEDFKRQGELAKHVIRPAAGPGGVTVKGPDAETITLYLAAKPGFHLEMEDGRLWVFKEGAKELKDFHAMGELAKHVIRPGAGPGGLTLKAPDAETLDAFLAAP
jgi:hypothetical protein